MNENPHILVVNDDRNMVRTLIDVLTVEGNAVGAAHSGPEALEEVSEASSDCVLTDT